MKKFMTALAVLLVFFIAFALYPRNSKSAVGDTSFNITYSIFNTTSALTYAPKYNDQGLGIYYTPQCLSECHDPIIFHYSGSSSPSTSSLAKTDVKTTLNKDASDDIKITGIKVLVNQTIVIPRTTTTYACTIGINNTQTCIPTTKDASVTDWVWQWVDLSSVTLVKDQDYVMDIIGYRKPSTQPHSAFLSINLYNLDLSGASWWNNSWSEKINESVNFTGSDAPVADLVNFTYLWNGSSVNTIPFVLNNSLRSDCKDLRIVNSTDNGELPWEWDVSSTDATYGCNGAKTTIWVLSPRIKFDNTTFNYFYLNNSASASFGNSSGANVWNASIASAVTYGARAVWHFSENTGTSANVTNAIGTPNANGGIQVAPTMWIDGRFGYGLNFTSTTGAYSSRANQSFGVLQSPVVASSQSELGNRTIEFWMYPRNVSGTIRLMGQGVDNVGNDFAPALGIGIANAGLLELDMGVEGLSDSFTTITTPVTVNQWHHVAFGWNFITAMLCLDGTCNYTTHGVSTSTPAEAGCIWSIGGRAVSCTGGGNQPFNGIIDELRVWGTFMSGGNVLNPEYMNRSSNEGNKLAQLNSQPQCIATCFNIILGAYPNSIQNGDFSFTSTVQPVPVCSYYWKSSPASITQCGSSTSLLHLEPSSWYYDTSTSDGLLNNIKFWINSTVPKYDAVAVVSSLANICTQCPNASASLLYHTAPSSILIWSQNGKGASASAGPLWPSHPDQWATFPAYFCGYSSNGLNLEPALVCSGNSTAGNWSLSGFIYQNISLSSNKVKLHFWTRNLKTTIINPNTINGSSSQLSYTCGATVVYHSSVISDDNSCSFNPSYALGIYRDRDSTPLLSYSGSAFDAWTETIIDLSGQLIGQNDSVALVFKSNANSGAFVNNAFLLDDVSLEYNPSSFPCSNFCTSSQHCSDNSTGTTLCQTQIDNFGNCVYTSLPNSASCGFIQPLPIAQQTVSNFSSLGPYGAVVDTLLTPTFIWIFISVVFTFFVPQYLVPDNNNKGNIYIAILFMMFLLGSLTGIINLAIGIGIMGLLAVLFAMEMRRGFGNA